ncbi:MAG: hypothetical protein OXC69_00225 [Candidatus Tectomicrobia bacterium]|nr:hypothetical protein [Candidatus Tectomicrobia bacterium]
MPTDLAAQGIAEGLLIGVGAGVTTAAILGMWHLLVRWVKRREQIPYIRDLIATQRERILSATDRPHPEPGQDLIPADHLRFAFFRELQSALLVALSSRATALTYKEISSLQKILADVDRTMTDLPFRERLLFPLALAQSFFGQLEALTWLRLPNRRT